MNILLYAGGDAELENRLHEIIHSFDSVQTLQKCWSHRELKGFFQRPDPLPETIILSAAGKEELDSFKWFRPRLDQVFFILVLPNADDSIIAHGHSLHPRFITYSDGDLEDIRAVLGRKMSRMADNESMGSEQSDYQQEEHILWNTQLKRM